jgi:hypothetical protein
MVVDPGDWLPLIGVGMLAVTTAVSIAGAYALGRSRRREIPATRDDDRLERLEHLVEVMAIEIERIGEGQRFLVKVMAEKQLSVPNAERPRTPERVITPH